jgi:hypothetical protein
MRNSTTYFQGLPTAWVSPAKGKPSRFVLPVMEDGERWRWRVVVALKDAAVVQKRAASGQVILDTHLPGWIRAHAQSWLQIKPSKYLTEFLSALNALRVTQSSREFLSGIEPIAPETPSRRIGDLNDVIEILTVEFAALRIRAGKSAKYPGDILQLLILAQQAADARGIKTDRKRSVWRPAWHSIVRLLEYYLRNLLYLAGSEKHGISAGGPMVGVIREGLLAVHKYPVTADAIAKALFRSTRIARKPLTLDQLRASCLVVVA